jgi:hypothetical protein
VADALGLQQLDDGPARAHLRHGPSPPASAPRPPRSRPSGQRSRGS